MTGRGYIHRVLNDAVLTYGEWPVVGSVVWWLFAAWQSRI